MQADHDESLIERAQLVKENEAAKLETAKLIQLALSRTETRKGNGITSRDLRVVAYVLGAVGGLIAALVTYRSEIVRFLLP